MRITISLFYNSMCIHITARVPGFPMKPYFWWNRMGFSDLNAHLDLREWPVACDCFKENRKMPPRMAAVRFRSINNEYYEASHHNIKLIIMKENGYVNGTKLCVHANKNINNWIRYNHSLINEYTTSLRSSSLSRQEQGTYFHPQSRHGGLPLPWDHTTMDLSTISHYCKQDHEHKYIQLSWFNKLLIKAYVMFQ